MMQDVGYWCLESQKECFQTELFLSLCIAGDKRQTKNHRVWLGKERALIYSTVPGWSLNPTTLHTVYCTELYSVLMHHFLP